MVENVPAELVVIVQIAVADLGLSYTMVEDMSDNSKAIVVGMTKNLWIEMMSMAEGLVCMVMEWILVDLGFDFAAMGLSGANLMLAEDFGTGLAESGNPRS